MAILDNINALLEELHAEGYPCELVVRRSAEDTGWCARINGDDGNAILDRQGDIFLTCIKPTVWEALICIDTLAR